MDKFLVTNFAYGTGPYLRTTELALALNHELEKRGKERMKIIVPLVYGEKQKQVMLEEFSQSADEIFLDQELGRLLKSIFYGDNTYEGALAGWIKNAKAISEAAHNHLSGKFRVTSLAGEIMEVYGRDIALELNRSPRVRYDIAPVYFTTFGYIAEILEHVARVPREKIAVNRGLIQKGSETANWVESAAKIHVVGYPATFSWNDDYKARYSSEILTPPITRVYEPNQEDINPGIFVTITGIPGLERLYQDAKRLGIKLYSNDPQSVTGSERVLPHIIPNPKMIFQFARSGWGSVWLSMMSGTPLVVPEFDPEDDPEIYFNNVAVENLGIGFVYRGEPLEEILKKTAELHANSKKLCDKILSRWGTLDGNQFCARLFVDEFLKAK